MLTFTRGYVAASLKDSNIAKDVKINAKIKSYTYKKFAI
jgi:hypothetical protein